MHETSREMTYYSQPVLVEASGNDNLPGLIEVHTNLDSLYPVTIDNGNSFGTVSLSITIEGESFYAGRLQILEPVLLISIDSEIIQTRSQECSQITAVVKNEALEDLPLQFVVLSRYGEVMAQDTPTYIQEKNGRKMYET